MVNMDALFSTLTAKPRIEWTDEQRRKAFGRMMFHCAGVARALYEAGAVEESKILTLQIDGGNCPRCGKPLEAVQVDNPYALGIRYRLACGHFPEDSERERESCEGMLQSQGVGIIEHGESRERIHQEGVCALADGIADHLWAGAGLCRRWHCCVPGTWRCPASPVRRGGNVLRIYELIRTLAASLARGRFFLSPSGLYRRSGAVQEVTPARGVRWGQSGRTP